MTLVIMAAGMGSRYGGLKQLDPLGPGGEFLIDYSIYDAKRAGFTKVVFVIKEENKELFEETIGRRISAVMPVEYVFQKLEDIPEGVTLPKDRVKPLGTAHAIYCCRNAVKENFAVINSDDYYGPEAFKLLADYLSENEGSEASKHPYCMVGYQLKNTLTENGTVSRGICQANERFELTDIVEHTALIREADGVIRNKAEGMECEVSDGTLVSMNCWGFTPALFDTLTAGLNRFFEGKSEEQLMKAEYYLLTAVKDEIDGGTADCAILETTASWFGVTYREDREAVQGKIQSLIKAEVYPEKLWE